MVWIAYGDNISPFEDGNNVYSADAKTIYGSLGYTIAGVELERFIWWNKMMWLLKKELNLTAGYSFTDSLAVGFILYANINADKKWCRSWL